MTKQEQAAYINQQAQKGFVAAYTAMLEFKRYKKTPVIISQDGRVLEMPPEQMPPAAPLEA